MYIQGVRRNMTVYDFKCLFPYAVLDIKDFFAVFFVEKKFNLDMFYFVINFIIITLPYYIRYYFF